MHVQGEKVKAAINFLCVNKDAIFELIDETIAAYEDHKISQQEYQEILKKALKLVDIVALINYGVTPSSAQKIIDNFSMKLK